MPALGNALDFAKYEGRNFRAHQLGTAPSSPVTGQLYYNTSDNTLWYWDGTQWVAAKSGAPTGAAGGDLSGTYPNPQIAAGVIVDADVASANKDGLAAVPSLRTLGTGAQQAAAGNDTRFSDSRPPNGAAGGDLSGTYPNPQILAGAIVNADVNATAAIARSKLDFGTGLVNADIAAAAAIAYSKLALTAAIVNGDIAAAAGIVYSKLNLSGSIVNADISASAAIALSKLAVDPLARANHTGTQLAATISNFDAQVRTNRLDQMAAPTAAVAFNAQKISGLADGTAATDAVTKQQLDAVSAGLDVKASVRAASIANLTLPATGGATLTVDGVTLANGDRLLLKNQTAPAENGIYVVGGIGTAASLARAADADVSAEVTPGMFTFVEEGSTQADTGWSLTTNAPITLGTTGLVFAQFSGAGSYVGGNGLSLTGNTFDVNVDNSSVEINADILRVKALGITNAMLAGLIDLTSKVTGLLPVTNGGTGQSTAKAARETGLAASGYYSSATHGAGTTITITQATHLLRSSRGIQVQVQDEATGAVEYPDIVVGATGDVTVTYGAALTANSKRVTLVG